MFTVVNKVDRTALIPFDSIEIPQVVGDPLSKAHFELKDQSASITLHNGDEVIFFDENAALTPSLVVPAAWSDSFASNDLSSYTATNGSGGSGATWTYNASSASIAFDADAGNKVGSGTTNTFSHTVAVQSNRILLVAVDAGLSLSSVTYNSVAMTSLGSVAYNSGETLSLYYLVAPSTGTHNVVITASGTTFIIGISASYYNAAQTSVFGTVATNSGASGTASTNTVTTTSTSQRVIDIVNNSNAGSDTPTASQTLRLQPAASGGALADIAATGSNMTLTWSFGGGSGAWAQLSVAMNPAGSGTATVSGTGGSKAQLLLNSWKAQSETVAATLTQSDLGGIAFNVVDTSNYYEVSAQDASSSSTQNTIILYRTVAATRTSVGSASISFTRGTSHTVGVTVVNNGSTNVITVTFDGTTKITYTDTSPLGSGQVGLRNDGGTAIFTAFSATSNDVPTLLTSVPTHNFLDNNNFNYGQGATWGVSGTLSAAVTFPSNPTFGTGAHATLTFANNAVGSVSVASLSNSAAGVAGPLIYIKAGQQYCFSLYLNITAAFVNSSCNIKMQFLDSTGAATGSAITQTFTATTSGVTRVSITGTAPNNANDLQVSFGGTTTSSTNSGSATFTGCMAEPMWFPASYSYPSPICDFLQQDSVTLPDGTASRFTRIFCGFITNIKTTYDGATRISTVEVTSADWLMENATLVNNTYNGVTDQAVITGIVNAISPAIIYAATPSLATGTPQALAYRNVPIAYAGVTVSGLEFADGSIREVMNALSALTGFLFGVDPYYNLFYYPPFYNAAAYAFSSSPDNVTTFAYYDYEKEEDGSQLQNAFNVTGATFSTTITEAWHFGDSSHTETLQAGKIINVLLKHIPNAVPTNVTVGGTGISCAQDTNVGYGTALSIVTVQGGYGTPSLLSFPSPGYASGTAISVTYAYDTLAYTQVQSPDSIAAYGRPLWGKIDDSSLLSLAATVAAGEANLQTYAQPRTTLRFKAQKMLSVGQVVTVTNTPDGITAQHFTVNKVTARHKSAGITEYEIEAGTYLDDFVDFFRNTQKALGRASHSPTAALQSHNILLQDSLSYGVDTLNIHP